MIPKIIKTEWNYEGSVSLHGWEKVFQKRQNIFLNIGGDAIVVSLERFHVNGYDYLIKNQEAILQVIITEVYNYYCETYKDYITSDIQNEEDIISNIMPEGIYIHNIEKGGIPYIGYEFSCKWDEEHGVGILLHKKSKVSIGEGDTAVLSWLIEDDYND